MATKTTDRETLQQAVHETHEQYARFERAAQAFRDAASDDALDEAEAALTVEAHWLGLKAAAVAELLNDERHGSA